MLTITSDAVRGLYARCARDEGTPDCDEVAAWMHRHTLDRSEVAECRTQIEEMLSQLLLGFREEHGAGGSVFDMRLRYSVLVPQGTPWTDDPRDIERLLALGLATEMAVFCVPRELWDKMPGGMPYVQIRLPRRTAS